MLTAPILWHMYLNKEDVLPIALPPLPPSLTLWPSPLGWTVAGFRKSRLMVFWVGRLSCGCCSLAGWCVTDSGRSLVSSPTYPACLTRLTRIPRWSITAILDSSRYSWKTCGERTPLTKVVHPAIHPISIPASSFTQGCGGPSIKMCYQRTTVIILNDRLRNINSRTPTASFWLHAGLTNKIIHCSACRPECWGSSKLKAVRWILIVLTFSCANLAQVVSTVSL